MKKLKRNALGGLVAPLPSGKLPSALQVDYYHNFQGRLARYVKWYGKDNPWAQWLEQYIAKQRGAY